MRDEVHNVHHLPGEDSNGVKEIVTIPDGIRSEALDWVLRLAVGGATTADADQLARWRAQSQAHRVAFAEANLAWQVSGPAAAGLAANGEASASYGAGAARRRIGRRAVLAAIGTSAAAGIVGAIVPPFGLWPSLAELGADHRTAIGERRQLDLSERVRVELNTRTSIAVLMAADRGRTIELIAGEAVIETRGEPLTVAAASGRMLANGAQLDVRCDRHWVSVACLSGTARVEHPRGAVSVAAGQVVRYDQAGASDVVRGDLERLTAWRRGLIDFQDDPLAAVIEEINRYRPGRIVLVNEALAKLSVVATFHIDQLADAGDRLARALGATARRMPGGVVILS
jgi:transmembrane sensor